jgi:hypothetical protein
MVTRRSGAALSTWPTSAGRRPGRVLALATERGRGSPARRTAAGGGGRLKSPDQGDDRSPGRVQCEHHGHTGGEVENLADDGIQREVEGDDPPLPPPTPPSRPARPGPGQPPGHRQAGVAADQPGSWPGRRQARLVSRASWRMRTPTTGGCERRPAPTTLGEPPAPCRHSELRRGSRRVDGLPVGVSLAPKERRSWPRALPERRSS